MPHFNWVEAYLLSERDAASVLQPWGLPPWSPLPCSSEERRADTIWLDCRAEIRLSVLYHQIFHGFSFCVSVDAIAA
jgi:hypothetical protein